jgi:hypothetical protein
MIYLTGDIHGDISVRRLASDGFPEGRTLTWDDYVIVLGDFGLVWYGSDSDEYWLDWLEDRPWTTLFIDGNHENFDLLDALPVHSWHGGRIHRVRPHVLHLMRGERFEIGGHSFFVVGGGHSIDKEWRTPHVTWWPQEAPSDEERTRIAARARELGQVDYVLTHVPPTGCYERYRQRFPKFWGPSDEYTDWLEEHVEGVLTYRRWYFGHLHMDLPDDRPHTVLYNQVVPLDD